jgi:hypothetical protein
MSIMLGNLSVAEMEARLGITFPAEAREALAAGGQERAGPVAAGKWHCFDIPFMLVCGDMAAAEAVHKLLPLAGQLKCPLQIGINTRSVI